MISCKLDSDIHPCKMYTNFSKLEFSISFKKNLMQVAEDKGGYVKVYMIYGFY